MKPIKTYFLKNNVNSLVKIGKSNDVERRVTQIVGQCKFIELSVFHVLDGDYESFFHNHYREYRKEGEWFDIPDLTVDKILEDFSIIRNQIELPNVVEPAQSEYLDIDLSDIEARKRVFILHVRGAVYWAAFFHYLNKHYPNEADKLIDTIITVPVEELFLATFEDQTGIVYVGREGYVKIDDVQRIDIVCRLTVMYSNKQRIMTLTELEADE